MWRLDGGPLLELDDPVSSAEVLTPDRCGEVHATIKTSIRG
ncbi:hypothetical protein BN6_20490 [Saccharothrix espanaensis DSM 44229]|uniref:Uncharacterized protein n=1 Tax=Saccharothrix espanaensis (strain ATCC 51144 / DSM 44229 / JCM 9112 / NBRC 15066 / NRRL 15764) TaxID=1179773 RepID=K0JTW6_SACES|nr:hypothetical protein BN6_20490 [Saccharothrix espanaensis DSM 44229]